MVFEFFGKAHRSSCQSSEPCTKPGISAFYCFCKLLSNQMLFIRQHGCKSFPVISQEEINFCIFQPQHEVLNSSFTSLAQSERQDFCTFGTVGLNHPYLLFFVAYIRPQFIDLHPCVALLQRLYLKRKPAPKNTAQHRIPAYPQHFGTVPDATAPQQHFEYLVASLLIAGPVNIF